MKKKEKTNLAQASKAELLKQQRDLEINLARLTVNRYTKPSKNTRESRSMRHTIAVIQTILRAKGDQS